MGTSHEREHGQVPARPSHLAPCWLTWSELGETEVPPLELKFGIHRHGLSFKWQHEEIEMGGHPELFPPLPAWRTCHRAASNCRAIVVPRDAWRSHRSGRWHVPTNEEKPPCVDFIFSFQNFRHLSFLSFRFKGLCNRIGSRRVERHRPTDLLGERVWKRQA